MTQRRTRTWSNWTRGKFRIVYSTLYTTGSRGNFNKICCDSDFSLGEILFEVCRLKFLLFLIETHHRPIVLTTFLCLVQVLSYVYSTLCCIVRGWKMDESSVDWKVRDVRFFSLFVLESVVKLAEKQNNLARLAPNESLWCRHSNNIVWV